MNELMIRANRSGKRQFQAIETSACLGSGLSGVYAARNKEDAERFLRLVEKDLMVHGVQCSIDGLELTTIDGATLSAHLPGDKVRGVEVDYMEFGGGRL